MASFTNVGDSVSISALEKDTPVVVNISGTYDMVIALQREIRGGSGAFEEVERYTTANAVVEDIFWSDREGQKFQLIVLSDTSGTATATIEIGQILGQAPDVAHTHTLSDITDSGTAAAGDIGTGAGDIPVLDADGDIPLSMLGKAPGGSPVVRLTGGSVAPTLAGYAGAIVIIDSGTQILTAPVSGTDVYYFRGVNKSANTATIGGVSIPQNEVFSVLVDGTDMLARNVW